MFANSLADTMATFVRDIGIDVAATTPSEPTFLPGIDIQCGGLRIDADGAPARRP